MRVDRRATAGETLLCTHLGDLPEVSLRLLEKGSETLGHETNLARAPLWRTTRERAVQLELLTAATTVFYGERFSVRGPALTVSDQRLLAELTTRYLAAGCPESRKVAFSLGDAARVLGARTLGGKQRALVRESLLRLRMATIMSVVSTPSGKRAEHLRGWGLVSTFSTALRFGDDAWVRLSEELASLLRAGSVTYLHGPTWDAIAYEDEVAGRLWSFLEAERIGAGDHGRRYQVFAAPLSGIAAERNMPAIAEVLRLDSWAVRRQAAWRVRRASSVISTHDPRYTLMLDRGRERGMWCLSVQRAGQAPLHAGVPSLGLPPAVVGAWREAFGGRRPSARQAAVLREILGRQPVDWVVATIGAAGDEDALQCLMVADRSVSARRLLEAREQERAWEAQKAGEISSAEEGLGSILRRMLGGDDHDVASPSRPPS